VKVEIDINDLDQKILTANNVNIQEWIEGAVAGMIHRHTKKLLKIAQKDLLEDETVTEMPATVAGMIELWLSKNYSE